MVEKTVVGRCKHSFDMIHWTHTTGMMRLVVYKSEFLFATLALSASSNLY
jgi:hypothetical protein